jgi:hypothetical protein
MTHFRNGSPGLLPQPMVDKDPPLDSMRAFFPLLLGQNPTPENHAKLLFTIGIHSGLRSAYHIKI